MLFRSSGNDLDRTGKLDLEKDVTMYSAVELQKSKFQFTYTDGQDALSQQYKKLNRIYGDYEAVGYTVNPNSGSPNIATTYWQLPMRVISAQLPIRSAALSDINGLESTVVEDLMLEFSQVEAASMGLNNDQTGTTTTTLGGTDGLRGFPVYGTSTSAASYGTSGSAMTNGIQIGRAHV